MVNCTEENGRTIIVICRAKNTSDANDTAVQVGLLTFQKVNVILYIVVWDERGEKVVLQVLGAAFKLTNYTHSL